MIAIFFPRLLSGRREKPSCCNKRKECETFELWPSQSFVCLSRDRLHLNLHSDLRASASGAHRRSSKSIWGGGGQLTTAEQGFHWKRNCTESGTSASKMNQICFGCLTLFLWAISGIEGEFFTLLHGCHSFASKSWSVAQSVHITFSANSANAPISLKAGNRYT